MTLHKEKFWSAQGFGETGFIGTFLRSAFRGGARAVLERLRYEKRKGYAEVDA
jgi:hypothetical protein